MLIGASGLIVFVFVEWVLLTNRLQGSQILDDVVVDWQEGVNMGETRGS
jgi:hypothetical protein